VPEPFVTGNPSHFVVLALTVAIPALLCAWERRAASPAVTRGIALAIGAVLLANKITVFSYACWVDVVPWIQRLPLQLCDWVTFLCIGALWWGRRTLCDLAYFWGLAGTLQAVLTPDLPYGFPHFYFFTFNISHSGILIALAYLVFAQGYRPDLRSILRAFLWLQLYGAVAGLTNWLFGQNFGYLCRKPVHPSLFDHLGPWPWYILSLEVFGLAFFFLYYAPFPLWRLARRPTPNAPESPAPSPPPGGPGR
jgi:hypothetical integral membrane protein (TIGR02206 family)